MKGLVGVAVLLGIVGVVLGAIALMDDGGAFEKKTLELTGAPEEDFTQFPVEGIDKSHAFGTEGFSSHREVSGDASGQQSITCTPKPGDLVECSGGFILEDGDIEIEGTEEASDDSEAVSAVVGGTGAYEGAIGSMEIEFDSAEGDGGQTYTLSLLIPSE